MSYLAHIFQNVCHIWSIYVLHICAAYMWYIGGIYVGIYDDIYDDIYVTYMSVPYGLNQRCMVSLELY